MNTSRVQAAGATNRGDVMPGNRSHTLTQADPRAGGNLPVGHSGDSNRGQLGGQGGACKGALAVMGDPSHTLRPLEGSPIHRSIKERSRGITRMPLKVRMEYPATMHHLVSDGDRRGESCFESLRQVGNRHRFSLLGERIGLLAGIDDEESVQFEIGYGRVHRTGHARRVGVFDFDAQPHSAPPQEQIDHGS